LALCYDIVKLTLDSTWLSGFTNSEGCFNVHIYLKFAAIIDFRTSLRFLLDQQFEPRTLLFIATLLCTGYISLRSNINEVYRLIISFFKSILVIITYFLGSFKKLRREIHMNDGARFIQEYLIKNL